MKRHQLICIYGALLAPFVGAGVLLSIGPTSIESSDAGFKVEASRVVRGPEVSAASFADFAAKGMPVASSPARMANETNVPDRKVQETHRFEFEADRDQVAVYFDRAVSACDPAWCTMLDGSVSTQGASHHASVNVRVDPDMLDPYMADVKGEGVGLELRTHSQSSQDRTTEFQDVSARQKSQEALRDRLLELTKSPKANDVGDLLNIERELARVQGQIESMDARLRSIDALTNRTSVHIAFRSEALAGPVSHPPYISNALNEVGFLVSKNTGQVIRIIAALLPYVLCLGLLAFFVFRILRLRKWKPANPSEKAE